VRAAGSSAQEVQTDLVGLERSHPAAIDHRQPISDGEQFPVDPQNVEGLETLKARVVTNQRPEPAVGIDASGKPELCTFVKVT